MKYFSAERRRATRTHCVRFDFALAREEKKKKEKTPYRMQSIASESPSSASSNRIERRMKCTNAARTVTGRADSWFWHSQARWLCAYARARDVSTLQRRMEPGSVAQCAPPPLSPHSSCTARDTRSSIQMREKYANPFFSPSHLLYS